MQKKDKIRLDDLEKKQVFTVPDKYFEDLPAHIRRKLNAKQEQTYPSFSWIRYSIGLVSLFVVLLAGYAWFIQSQPEDPYQIISGVADTEIIDYLQLHDLSQYDIIEAASNADITIEDQFFQQTDINSELLMDEADEEMIQDYI